MKKYIIAFIGLVLLSSAAFASASPGGITRSQKWTGNPTAISYGGNVGIGSTSPRGALDLSPDGQIYGDGSQLTGISAASGWTTDSSTKTTTTYNVGIGSTSPQSALDVNGSVYATGSMVADTHRSTNPNERVFGTTSAIFLNEIGTYGTAVHGGVAVGTTFTASANTARLWVDGNLYTTSGNIGIGSSAPRQALDVEGSVYVLTNVGIGTANPLVPLYVNGAVTSSGTITGNLVSSVGAVNATAGNGSLTSSSVGGYANNDFAVKSYGRGVIQIDSNLYGVGISPAGL